MRCESLSQLYVLLITSFSSINMEKLTNQDLFFFLNNLNLNISYNEQLYNFVIQKLNIDVSASETSDKIIKYLRTFCSNISARWKKSHRNLETFKQKHNSWLNKKFKVPDSVYPRCSYESACNTSSSYNKFFGEVTERHKRRRTQDLRESNSTEVLLYATKQKLLSNGSSDIAKILDYLIKNPNEAKRIRACCENRVEVSLYSKEKCLALLLSLNLSKSQYLHLRETCIESGTNQFVSYYNVQQAKSECYPSKNAITVTETTASIELQVVLDLTSVRLLKVSKQNLDSHTNLKLICKWGFDGASAQSTYKQKFQEDNVSDNSIVMTSFVPIKLISDCDTVWANPNPSSTRYCRPIKFEFIHENAEISKKEYERMQNKITHLLPTKCENITVNYEMLFTMIDGKVCTALSDIALSCSTCYLCGAKPSEMNDINKVLHRNVDINAYNYGISNLHARIRCMEFLLHVSYNLTFKKWSVRDPVLKKQREENKKRIQQEFREKLGLLIDIVKQGSGTTNDGNTARRFFSEIHTTAEITGLDEALIRRFSVILQAISCGEIINSKKFGLFALETAKKCIETYGWYNMTASVHKLLIHGEAIISNFSIPIGHLSEEASEARNKEFRKYRRIHSRKMDRIKTNEDILHQLLVSSDPVVSNLRQKNSEKKRQDMFPETLEMLL